MFRKVEPPVLVSVIFFRQFLEQTSLLRGQLRVVQFGLQVGHPNRLREAAKEVVGHQAEQKHGRANRQRGNHFKPRRTGQGHTREHQQGEQNQNRRRRQPPVHCIGRLPKAVRRRREVGDEHKGQRGHDHDRRHRIGHKRTAQKIIRETANRVSQRQRAAKDAQRLCVGVAVSVEGHPAGQKRAEGVHVSQHGERGGQTKILGEEKLRATHGLGQNGQRCAGTNFVRDRRRRVQHRAEQTGQQHHRQCAVLDQLGIVAKTEVRDGGEKDVEQRRAGHEQQKNRLPHEFHKRIAGDGKKLPHGRFN